jgi:IclR family acetate operon transcriptional repressor
MEANTRQGAESFRTIGRVARLLELLADSPQPLRLTDVAQALEVPFSSTHGLLQALVRLQLAEMSGDERRYMAGPRLRRLGIRVVSRLDIIDVARPRIARLVSQIDEDAYLALYEGRSFSHVQRFESSHSLRLNISLGVPRPLHSTAAGKLYLASLDPSERSAVLAEIDLEKFTPYTLVQPEILSEHLDKVHRQGFAISDQESIEGVTSTGAPVYDAAGRLIGAVTSPIPRSRYVGRDEVVTRAVVETAADISAVLGWQKRT